MKTIDRRIRKLEDRFGLGNGKPPLLLILTAAGRGLALDEDTCVRILRESGFLPTGAMGIVNLGVIPKGLNAEELERFLRKDGAVTRDFRSGQDHGGPAGASFSG